MVRRLQPETIIFYGDVPEECTENIVKIKACRTVFSEPPVDTLYRESFKTGPSDRVFSVEFLPGQFDQRADSAVQCVKFLKEDEEPIIKWHDGCCCCMYY